MNKQGFNQRTIEKINCSQSQVEYSGSVRSNYNGTGSKDKSFLTNSDRYQTAQDHSRNSSPKGFESRRYKDNISGRLLRIANSNSYRKSVERVREKVYQKQQQKSKVAFTPNLKPRKMGANTGTSP